MRGADVFAALAILGIGGALSYSAAAASAHWRFDLVNKSNVAAVEFRTQVNGSWSPNWIGDRIEPGDKFHMDFGSDMGADCNVRTEIRFTDGSFFDADVDYCKVTTLYIFDNKLTWE
jgi:acetyltransferase-like isoleucine patch superfamily enzyme